MLKVFKGKRHHSERDFKRKRRQQWLREYNKYRKYRRG